MALDKLTKLTSQSGIRTTLDYSMSDLTVDTITIRSGGGIGGGRINTGLVTVTTLTPGTVVHVGTGQTLTESDNLTWDNTNVRLKNLGITSTKDLKVTGVSTFVGDLQIDSDSGQIKLGDDQDLLLYHNGSNGFLKNSTGQQLYRSGTHTFENAAGNAEYFRVHSTGEVTIGTATGTGNNLTVQDAGTSTAAGGNIVARFQSNAAGRDASIQLSDNTAHSALISMVSSNYAISLSGTERFRIEAGGNVGIGTTDPATLLHLENAAPVLTVKATNASSGLRINVKGQSSGQLFRIQDDNTTKFVLEEGGMVGIGTDNPIRHLHIADYTVDSIPLRIENRGSNTGLELVGGAAKHNFYLGKQKSTDNGFEITPSTAAGNTTFSNPAITVKHDGKVGIGSASPDHALDVNDTGLARIRIRNDATASGSYASLNLHTAKGNWSLYSEGTSSANNYLKIWNNVDGSVFYIKEGGNIGINEDSPDQILHITHASSPTIRTTLNDTSVSQNNVFGAWEFESLDSSTGSSGVIGKIDCIAGNTFDGTSTNGSAIRFHTSGTNSISLTERLRILSGGTIRHILTGGSANFTISRNESVTSTDQTIGVVDFASNTAHTVQARVMGKTRGTSNVGGDLVVEARADGGSLDERFRITGSGSIGINTSSPSTSQDLTFNGASNYKAGILYKQAGVNQYRFMCEGGTGHVYYDTYVDAGDHIFRTNAAAGASEKLRITEEGLVGIGTAIPNQILNVDIPARTTAFDASDGDTWHDVLIENPGAATNNAVGLAFQVSGDSYHTNAGTGIACVKNGTNSDYGADMVFITRPQSAVAAERLRIHDDGYIVAQGSICAGGDNAAAQLIRSGGNNRAFMHYFNCVKTVATGTGATRDIVTVTGLGSFHQSIIIVEYGTRLQAVSDQTTGCVHRAYGINRFNSGTLTVTETNAVFGSTNSLDDALINIEVVSNTEFRVRLTFASNLGTSSFASGMVRGFACNDHFNTISFDHGWGGG